MTDRDFYGNPNAYKKKNTVLGSKISVSGSKNSVFVILPIRLAMEFTK